MATGLPSPVVQDFVDGGWHGFGLGHGLGTFAAMFSEAAAMVAGFFGDAFAETRGGLPT